MAAWLPIRTESTAGCTGGQAGHHTEIDQVARAVASARDQTGPAAAVCHDYPRSGARRCERAVEAAHAGAGGAAGKLHHPAGSPPASLLLTPRSVYYAPLRYYASQCGLGPIWCV